MSLARIIKICINYSFLRKVSTRIYQRMANKYSRNKNQKISELETFQNLLTQLAIDFFS